MHADSRARNPQRVSSMVIAAAQAAGLHESIIALPEMYKTMISPYPVAPEKARVSGQCSQLQQTAPGPQQDGCGAGTCSDGDESAPVRAETSSVEGGMLQGLPAPHVPNAAEMELLAIARKNYLTLRAQKRIRRVNGCLLYTSPSPRD